MSWPFIQGTSMNPLKIAIAGASGRMGQALIRAVCDHDQLNLAGALDRKGSDAIGKDAGHLAGLDPVGVAVEDDPLPLFSRIDALIDFTLPEASVAYAKLAAQARIVHIIGTTGFDEDQLQALQWAAHHARLVKSGNMSLGVNLLAGLVAKAAELLPEEYDIEIVEMHHRHKVDAPSGTALLLGEAASYGRYKEPVGKKGVYERYGRTGAREQGSIGFATLRGGSVVGDHTVILAGQGERIELSHKAEDRTIFAHGALKAALWAYDQKPGLYSMKDVLGL
jgi:4-hydroxy-tetrahydrodipicolinate reductase